MSVYCDCGQQAVICFIEVIEKKITKTYKCEGCFNLDEPTAAECYSQDNFFSHKKILVSCSNCNTSWQMFVLTRKMGCAQCYQAFKNTLILYLKENNLLDPNFSSADLSSPLHIGHCPYSNHTINPVIQLITLKEALNEMLKIEEYEQAAILRDQIELLKNQGFSNE